MSYISSQLREHNFFRLKYDQTQYFSIPPTLLFHIPDLEIPIEITFLLSLNNTFRAILFKQKLREIRFQERSWARKHYGPRYISLLDEKWMRI